MPDIKAFETMAMLDLPDAEREQLSERLNALTDRFESLSQIDTEGVEPLVTVLDLHNILRKDVSDKLLTRDELLSNAPARYDGYFQVPGTLE